MNLFEEGISPKWEDPKNVNGTTMTLSYEVKDKDDLRPFLQLIREYWLKLIMIVLGESLILYKYVIKFIKILFINVDKWNKINR